MDYNGLKRLLREIREPKQNKRSKFRRALSRLNSHSTSFSSENQVVIGINTVQQDGSCKFFKTNFLEERSEIEGSFFVKLDGELNKVCEFYKGKIEEMVDEANGLNKQMEVLAALRIKFENCDLEVSNSKEHREEEEEEEQQQQQSQAKLDHECLGVLEQVKINFTIQTPLSTLKAAFRYSNSREDPSIAKEQLKAAFIEFYRKLNLLKQYSFTNLTAFLKIMKKYEKITSRRAARACMEVVDNSYLGNSDEIIDLLERVESTFIQNSNSNCAEAMKSLRLKRRRERHWVTFSSGFFSGFAIALIVAIVLRIESQKLMKERLSAIHA